MSLNFSHYRYAAFFVTATLGASRNYSKYRTFDPLLFVRSPILSYVSYALLKTITPLLFSDNTIALQILSTYINDLWLLPASLILERWIMLSYKSVVSLWNDDYNVKKEKYKIKHGISYNDLPEENNSVGL